MTVAGLFIIALREFGHGSLGNIPLSFGRNAHFAVLLLIVKSMILLQNRYDIAEGAQGCDLTWVIPTFKGGLPADVQATLAFDPLTSLWNAYWDSSPSSC